MLIAGIDHAVETQGSGCSVRLLLSWKSSTEGGFPQIAEALLLIFNNFIKFLKCEHTMTFCQSVIYNILGVPKHPHLALPFVIWQCYYVSFEKFQVFILDLITII